MFTDREHRGPFEFSDELGSLSIGAESTDKVVSAQQVEANDKDLLLSISEKEDVRVPTNNGSAYRAPPSDSSASLSASQTSSDLVILEPSLQASPSLAIDDLLGLGLSTAPASAAASPPPLNLNSKAILDPGTFQQKWRQLPISLSEVRDFFFTCLGDISIWQFCLVFPLS